jgi:quinol monooxygenase YgiN
MEGFMKMYLKQTVLLLSVLVGSLTSFAADTGEKPIGLLTYLHLKPGTEEGFKAEVAKIVRVSRAEPGNIAWYVQQSVEDPTQVVFYTRWANEAALDWHLKSQPIVDYIRKTAPMLAEPVRLVRFDPLDLSAGSEDGGGYDNGGANGDDVCTLCP